MNYPMKLWDDFLPYLLLIHTVNIRYTDCATCRQFLLYPACGQAFALRGLNTVHVPHLPPLLCLRPCGQRNRTDNSTCIDHQGRVSIALPLPPPSVSLCNFPFVAVFLAVSWDPLSRREKAQTEHQNARQPSKHLSFVLCTNHDESYWDCSFLFLFCFTFFCFVPGSCFIKFAGETEGKENRQREKKKKKTHSQLWVRGNDQKRAV